MAHKNPRTANQVRRHRAWNKTVLAKSTIKPGTQTRLGIAQTKQILSTR